MAPVAIESLIQESDGPPQQEPVSGPSDGYSPRAGDPEDGRRRAFRRVEDEVGRGSSELAMTALESGGRS